MKRLEEIFQSQKEVKIAKAVLVFLEKTIVSDYEMGIPLDVICSLGNCRRIILRLVEESYLDMHPGNSKKNQRICLSEDYARTLK